MRLANISKTVLLLASSAVLVTSTAAQVGRVDPATVRDQLNKPPAASQPKPAPAKPVAAKPAAPKPATSKSASSQAAPGQSSANAQSKVPGTNAGGNPGEDKTTGPRRDPFDALLNKARPGTGVPENLPPGPAGLVVETLRVDGIVRGKGGMIAIVSNPQQRVYFVREGDKLYDGSVEHITLEAVSFHELGRDAFGKPTERQVTKRLYPSPGEEQ